MINVLFAISYGIYSYASRLQLHMLHDPSRYFMYKIKRQMASLTVAMNPTSSKINKENPTSLSLAQFIIDGSQYKLMRINAIVKRMLVEMAIRGTPYTTIWVISLEYFNVHLQY